jgi:hypothetical protein
MIRALLASPWLPLLYWAAAVIALVGWAHHQAIRRDLDQSEFEVLAVASMSTSAPSHGDCSAPALRPAKEGVWIDGQLRRFWYPLAFVLQRENSPVLKDAAGLLTNQTSISTQTSATASITMLSIRVDPPGQAVSKTLTIRCRTSEAISNAQGRAVTIHGVITQEVVSSAGKILIMAGSRVVGSGLLDAENGRFKSDGLWSVFFDDTELQVQAELLDRPSGLPGILGHEMSNEDPALQKEVVRRDGRSIVVPRNAPFVLELHGDFLLRDLRASEASN